MQQTTRRLTSIPAKPGRGGPGQEMRSMACCLAALLLFFAPSGLRAQTGVAATVGDQDIRVERLQLQVELVLARTPAEGQKLEIIKAQVLEENIKQRLVNIYLQQSKFKATSAEVELELSNLKRELVEGNSSFEKYLEKRNISEQQLKQSLGWDIAWSKYLDNFLTEKNLARYFQQHQARFDGTELRVAHILIKPEDESSDADWKTSYQQAQKIYEDLKSKKISFQQAVIEHSSGATKINRGDLGWINWRGPMAPRFTRAAFELKQDEISQPVQTTFGFHLIQLQEIKPGKIRLEDTRPQVVQSVKRYLFEWLARKQAETTAVKFSGAYPYFEPGTRTLGKLK